MIRLSNGHMFEYMTASGALGYDGKGWPWERPLCSLGLLDPTLFTSVIKTLTINPTVGNLRWYNPMHCIRFIKGGIVNAVGLTNPGIDWWCKTIGPTLNSKKIPIVASILGEPEELAQMAGALNGFDIVGLEINASCPNSKKCNLSDATRVISSCNAVKSSTSLPLILKLSVTHDFVKIVRSVENMVDAFSINSVPWALVFPDKQSPLSSLGRRGVWDGCPKIYLEAD